MHSLTIIALPHQRIVLSAQMLELLIQPPHIHLQLLAPSSCSIITIIIIIIIIMSAQCIRVCPH